MPQILVHRSERSPPRSCEYSTAIVGPSLRLRKLEVWSDLGMMSNGFVIRFDYYCTVEKIVGDLIRFTDCNLNKLGRTAASLALMYNTLGNTCSAYYHPL